MRDKKNFVTQYNIYMADLGKGEGSEQSGRRPVLIVQNNMGNVHSSTTLICPITSKSKTNLPTHHMITKKEYSFLTYKENIILAEQVKCIDKSRITYYLGKLKNKDIEQVKKCLKINFDL